MTRKSAARSLIAYLNHFGATVECKHGHKACAIRPNGVCIDEVIATYPDLGDMQIAELRDAMNAKP